MHATISSFLAASCVRFRERTAGSQKLKWSKSGRLDMTESGMTDS
jgi:hypothetical protein